MSTKKLDELSTNDYWKSIKKIYTICRKKYLTHKDEQTLIKNIDLRDRYGHSLLTYYLLKGRDINIVHKMINNGHKLIIDDLYDILYSLCHSLDSNCDNHIFECINVKIYFIIDNIIKYNIINKKQITMYILNHVRYNFNYYIFIKNIIKRNVFIHNLPNYNIVYYSSDINVIKMFYENFTMDNIKDDIFENIIYGYKELNIEYIKFIIEKKPNLITDNMLYELIRKISLNIDNINGFKNIYNIFKFIYLIRDKPDKIKEHWKKIIIKFLERKPHYNMIYVILAGIMLGDLKDFPEGFVKGLRLTKNNFEEIIKNNIIVLPNSFVNPTFSTDNCNGIYPIYLFYEDFEEKHKNQLNDMYEEDQGDYLFNLYPFIHNAIRHHYSKQECIEEKKKIFEYIKSIK